MNNFGLFSWFQLDPAEEGEQNIFLEQQALNQAMPKLNIIGNEVAPMQI